METCLLGNAQELAVRKGAPTLLVGCSDIMFRQGDADGGGGSLVKENPHQRESDDVSRL